MNDWLDYKGSGSARAYMGDILAHGLFSNTEAKQREADMRLLKAKRELIETIKNDLRNARLNTSACSKKLARLENEKKELDQKITELSAAYKDARQTDPLKAHQMFAAKEHELKKMAEAFNDKIATEKRNFSKYANLESKLKSKMIALQQEISELEKSLSQ